jgi:hypothetical protein
MAQPARALTTARNVRIVECYYVDGASYTGLADQFGLSESSVKKIVKRDKLENGDRERIVKPSNPRGSDRKPISRLHAHIGLLVDRAVSGKINPSKFGQGLNPPLSSAKIHDIRRGHHDMTIRQMQGIAYALGLSLDQLVTFA